jgi:hypothetical protein
MRAANDSLRLLSTAIGHAIALDAASLIPLLARHGSLLQPLAAAEAVTSSDLDTSCAELAANELPLPPRSSPYPGRSCRIRGVQTREDAATRSRGFMPDTERAAKFQSE